MSQCYKLEVTDFIFITRQTNARLMLDV